MKALGKGGPKVSSDAGTWGKGPSSQCFLSPLTAELMLRMTPGYDITEPPTLSQERKGHEAAAVGVGMGVAGWAGGRGNRHRLCSLAPSQESTNTLARGAESLYFIDRPDFFDYPDSDQARLLAVAQFIGEKPVIFVNSGSTSDFFHHILVGALVVAFFFLLYQFCTHM
ncbi:fertilization-influencing membrane protein [Mustela nigripes]|uniref:fertilization-influencing membrane protein n=1 Tax=Mustela nigripes TaxID=77151 RepID=UPI0028150779|nr:fertilization-influencing membrane protein [Mustela nigripes]